MSITSNNHDVNQQVDRDYAEAWRPEPGDKLVGEVVELSQRSGEYGDYPIVTIRRDDGTELAMHAFHSVAAGELAKARPQVGERIAIKYVGRKAGADGRSSYHAYRIAVDRPAPTFNWGAFAAESQPGEPPAAGSDIPATVEEFAAPSDEDIPF